MEIEHFFTCPYCWQEISFVLDLSVSEQSYIEDCEVCCKPIQMSYATENGEIAEFRVEELDE